MDKRRQENGDSKPVNIYEVHLGSWKMVHGRHIAFHDLAIELAAYCKEMGYTPWLSLKVYWSLFLFF